MTKVPFFGRSVGYDRKPNKISHTPHVRFGFLIYSRFLDWMFAAKTRHLFWRFWWIKFQWEYAQHWIPAPLLFALLMLWV